MRENFTESVSTENQASQPLKTDAEPSRNVVRHQTTISKQMRMDLKKQKPCILWFTGLSGSGKSTTANGVELALFNQGYHTQILDGDNIRHGLNKDLGFGDADRVENIRRIGEVSKLFVDAGLIVLTAFISPFRSEREIVRELVERDEFIEIFVDTPIQICERRDPKGLYKKARAGHIKKFTGIDSPYEQPTDPDLVLRTDQMSESQCVDTVIRYLQNRGVIQMSPPQTQV